MKQLSLAMLAVLSITAVPTAHAQCEVDFIRASDSQALSRFGGSAAMTATRLAIGAPGDDSIDTDSGAVHVFESIAGEWQQVAKLTASDGSRWERFGDSIAMRGGELLVGAPRFEPGSTTGVGSAYLFRLTPSGWTEVHKFTASDAVDGDHVGYEVALGPRSVMLGSWRGSAGSRAGSTYVFTRTGAGWTETQKLEPTGAAQDDEFGIGISIDGDRAAISSGRTQLTQSTVHVFERNAGVWSEVDALSPPGMHGADVALGGDVLAFGGYLADVSGVDSGAIYTFEYDGSAWIADDVLETANPHAGERFGTTVAYHTNKLLAQAGSQQVKQFTRRARIWSNADGVWGLDSPFDNEFGTAIATHSGRGVIGAPGYGGEAGAAHVFDLAPFIETYCSATPSSWGTTPRTGLHSCNYISTGHLVLRSFPVPAGNLGLIFYGPQRAQLPFGDGIRCVSGPLVRGPASTSNAQINGFWDLTVAPNTQITASSTWYFQCWYRDPAGGPAGFNFSLPIAITFLP